ncbi:Far-red impaired responsive (FAR1) family protein [Striga hermonthica]|uniref:Far-red impaired responsive (FAR1) family protein n=1 Tax=Striga hermonthica TaxID=68872 RepID=A0A9N7MR71_STRHE|nr:Far-red impaired responsive (FAR1) family protein [Striga hermonthica]
MTATQSSSSRDDKGIPIPTGLASLIATTVAATTTRPAGCRPSLTRTRTTDNLPAAVPFDYEDSQDTPAIYIGMKTEQVDKVFIPQVDSTIVPKIGLQFQLDEKAHIFYNTYAKDVGFIIEIRNDEKNKIDDTFVWRDFTCSKQDDDGVFLRCSWSR